MAELTRRRIFLAEVRAMGGGRSRRIAVVARGLSLAPPLLTGQRRIRSRARRVFARPRWRGADCSHRSQPTPRRQPAGWTPKCGSPSRKGPSRLPGRARRAIRASRPAGLRISGPGTFRRRTAAVIHCALSSWNMDSRAELNARYKESCGCLRSGLFVLITSAVHTGGWQRQQHLVIRRQMDFAAGEFSQVHERQVFA